MPEPEPYLTPLEVARMLRVHVKTILRLAKSDPSMPLVRLGPQVLRFPRQKLLLWLQARESGRSRGRSAHRSAHGGAGHVSQSVGTGT